MVHHQFFVRAVAGLAIAAAVGCVSIAAALAQTSAAPSVDQAAPAAPKCSIAADEAHFAYPLSRVAYRLAAGLPLKIVAIGSSSTFGAGASSPAASYPSRLAIELGRHFAGHDLTVLNRGVNGEEAPDMLARFEKDVIAERPDLVLWQLGTNSVLRDRAFDPEARPLRSGIARLKEIRSDIVLIDPQFVPKVIDKPNAEAMVALLAAVAKKQKVDLFARFAAMRRWHDSAGLPFESFTAPDGLHMNDWGYSCLAKGLGVAIADAANRPTATAAAPHLR